jgi:beta-lactamase regulating signal transducer with metallopeptidase domain
MNLQDLLPESIVQAVCLTLAHSLWQGILLAMLTAMIVLLTKRSTAVKRYGLLVGAMCLFTLSFFVTLIIELNSQNTSGLQPSLVAPERSSGISGMLNFCCTYIREHAVGVVNIWLLIIGMRCLYLIFGLYSLERIKRIKVKPAGPYWEALVARLAGTMGVSRAVTLLESGIVKIPVVTGYLKPVILVPAGLLTGLGQEEVEMILLHELAHVLRKDYLVNILQSLVETLFFFNPAVIWWSSLIRAERENCCDDMVIKHTKDRIGYIKALIHYEQYRAGRPAYAAAFSGPGTGTLRRVERVISNRNHSLHRLEVFGLAVLVSIGVFLTTFRQVRVHDPGRPELVFSREESEAKKKESAAEKKEFEAKKKAEAEAAHRSGAAGQLLPNL